MLTPSPLPRWPRPASLRPPTATLLATMCAALAACGEAPTGGEQARVPAAALTTMRITGAHSIEAAVSSKQAARVRLAPIAERLDGGAVTIVVRVACAPGFEVLEALVTVSQEQAFGQSGIPAVCDGEWHKFTVTVTPLDGALEPGAATASAFVLLIDPTTEDTASAQDSRTVRIK